MRTVLAAAAAIAMSLSGAVQAQTAGSPPVMVAPKVQTPPVTPLKPNLSPAQARLEREVRCLLVMSVLAGQPERREMGMLGVYFFSGRILQLSPNFDFVSGLRAVGSQMDPPTLKAEAPRCGTLLQTAARQLQAAQKALAPPKPGAPPPSAAKPAP